MYDHEVRWYALVPVAMLVAFAHIFAEAGGWYPQADVRPDWFWCLAFIAALRTPPTQAIVAFFTCGLIRDILVGPRLGAAAIAFLLIGYLTLSWRILASQRNYASQCLLAAVTAFLVAMLKHSLDYGGLTYKLIDRVFLLSLGDAVLTLAAYVPMSLILSLDSFRPWKERSGF
ncbi:MAG: rod shape-determining protein MreD [Planctomycetaceae bacterium]|nr:rod shape-determining protein MreD [Planctomycetaceae bacterium]